MARGRFISKSLSTSRKFADLHSTAGASAEFCQVLYCLLVTHADDFGRLDGDPWTIKHDILPTSPRDVSEVTRALEQLVRVGLIVWYEGTKRRTNRIQKVIQIEQFDEHQILNRKRTHSWFEAPGPDGSGNFREFPGTSGKLPELPGTSIPRQKTEDRREKTEVESVGIAPNVDRDHLGTVPRVSSAHALEKPSIRGGQKEHRGHAWCCSRGLCVPHAMHEELAGRLGNGDDVGLTLIAFYDKTIRALNGQPVGDTVWQFWRNSFAAEFGTVTREPSAKLALGKGERSVMAMQKVMERRRLKP